MSPRSTKSGSRRKGTVENGSGGMYGALARRRVSSTDLMTGDQEAQYTDILGSQRFQSTHSR